MSVQWLTDQTSTPAMPAWWLPLTQPDTLASGPLHVLCILPGMLFPRYHHSLFPQLRPSLKHHVDTEAFPGGICQIPLSDTSFSSLLIFFSYCICYQMTPLYFLYYLSPPTNRFPKDFLLLIDQSTVSRTLLTCSKSPRNVCWMRERWLLPAPLSSLSEQDDRPGEQMGRIPYPAARRSANHRPGDRGQSWRKGHAVPR